MDKSWKELGNDLIMIIFIVGTIGIALKFTTFFDQWVYFPAFPNTLDSAFLISAVLYMGGPRLLKWRPWSNDPQLSYHQYQPIRQMEQASD
jgi:hypothetical protein